MTVLEVVGSLFLLLGGAFGIIGAAGLLRFPDFFSRIHAGSLADTLGAGLILFGLILLSPSLLVAIKLLLVFFFLMFTAPTATHALAQTALQNGYRPPENGVDGGRRG